MKGRRSKRLNPAVLPFNIHRLVLQGIGFVCSKCFGYSPWHPLPFAARLTAKCSLSLAKCRLKLPWVHDGPLSLARLSTFVCADVNSPPLAISSWLRSFGGVKS